MKKLTIILLTLSVLSQACNSWEYACFPVPYTISTGRSNYPADRMQKAAEWWNFQVGEEIFNVNSGGNIEVWQYSGGVDCGNVSGAAGCAEPRVGRNGEIKSCYISMKPNREEASVEILQHELGHCMGLPHVDDINNLMHKGGPNEELNERQINHIWQCASN